MKTYFVPQGISADIIATEYGFSRDGADALAVESQRRAAEAWAENRFARSIVPVKDQNGLTILDRDEYMRGYRHAGARPARRLLPGRWER